MLAILGSSGVCVVGLGGGAYYTLNHDIAFWDDNSVNRWLFAHPSPLVGHSHFNTFYRCSWNLMVTQFVSKPPAPIMEEVTGGNITASYSAALRSGWDLGQMAEVRKYRAGMERVEKWHPPFLPFPPSSAPLHPLRQTHSWGVNCGERKPAFSSGSVYILSESTFTYSMAWASCCIGFMNAWICTFHTNNSITIYFSTGNGF